LCGPDRSERRDEENNAADERPGHTDPAVAHAADTTRKMARISPSELSLIVCDGRLYAGPIGRVRLRGDEQTCDAQAGTPEAAAMDDMAGRGRGGRRHRLRPV
jgi:hypothetical protein